MTNTHGGKREGSGRKKGVRGPRTIQRPVYLTPANFKWLKAHGGVTKVVNELVEKERRR